MPRPNILFIITDHHAWANHFGPGRCELAFPAWERFTAEGVRFDRAYSISPLCSPARASMMTGLRPRAHGIERNVEGPAHIQRASELRPGQELYSHHLARAGYRNAYVGKWHCGAKKLPSDYGIDGWSLPGYGYYHRSPAYAGYAAARGLDAVPRVLIDHYKGHPELAGRIIEVTSMPGQSQHGAGVLQGPTATHECEFTAHLAAEKLAELARGGQPFSLVASFWGPHQPYYPSAPFATLVDPASIPEYPSFRDDLRGRPMKYFTYRECHQAEVRSWRGNWPLWRTVLSRVYAQQLQLDAAIGSLLDRLAALGLAEDTLVIWCADHGDAVASHGGLWDKGAIMTEEVMRIPMAVRWPAAFRGGRSCARLVSNLDATATMLRAAGVGLPPRLDSRDLLPLCAGDDAAWPDQLVCEHYGNFEVAVQRMLVWKRWKYVAAIFDQHELYDLEADPYEMRNAINDPAYATIADEGRSRLLEHLETNEYDERGYYEGNYATQLAAAVRHYRESVGAS